jgi:hypothetical protein
MTLLKLPMTSRWVFAHSDGYPAHLPGQPTFYPSRERAVASAMACGLDVLTDGSVMPCRHEPHSGARLMEAL